jgi:hypothetical protein
MGHARSKDYIIDAFFSLSKERDSYAIDVPKISSKAFRLIQNLFSSKR